jgi:hypothetical protein
MGKKGKGCEQRLETGLLQTLGCQNAANRCGSPFARKKNSDQLLAEIV